MDRKLVNKEIAYCQLKQHRNQKYLVIPCCPFCGTKHTHGASEGDPLGEIGARVAHCGKGEYVLRLIGDTPRTGGWYTVEVYMLPA